MSIRGAGTDFLLPFYTEPHNYAHNSKPNLFAQESQNNAALLETNQTI
jgi:hypothetical protein